MRNKEEERKLFPNFVHYSRLEYSSYHIGEAYSNGDAVFPSS
jgi:hypothetical protein